MTDPTQSRSCQRARIVNNEEIKLLIQNRPTTVAKNRRRSWKSGTQLSQAETIFSPPHLIIWELTCLHDFLILWFFFFLSSFSIHSRLSGGKHESRWLHVVCRSLHLPPPPSWWCLFLPHLFHDVHWNLNRLPTSWRIKLDQVSALAQYAHFTLCHMFCI